MYRIVQRQYSATEAKRNMVPGIAIAQKIGVKFSPLFKQLTAILFFYNHILFTIYTSTISKLCINVYSGM
jgi:hypothetical protein